jgi:8-amino-7-oxononanoate synthase
MAMGAIGKGGLKGELEAELADLEARDLRRQRPRGPGGIDFCSNDYLGLARAPELARAGIDTLERAGAGARAARLLGGGGPEQGQVEARAAAWLGAEDALLFPSGYQANLGLVGALVDRRDALVCDSLLHASLIDAARLSRAQVEVVPHGDLAALEDTLAKLAGARRRLVLTEGVFSMDGDRAPLLELAAACEKHDAWLLVDEAHSAGLLGPQGAGAWAELAGRAPARLLARLVTGGKALGVAGALVLADRCVIELLVNRARSFIFSTAPAPALAGMLARAIELQPKLGRERQHCLDLARRLHGHLAAVAHERGLPPPAPPAAAIVPWILGEERAALESAAAAQAAGFDVRAVRPPTVPAGSARLRLVTHANNRVEEVDRLAEVLAAALRGRLPQGQARSAAGSVPAGSAPAGGGPTAAPAQRPSASASRDAAALAPGRILVVAGTDTGVGKTVGSAWALHVLERRGPLGYWKPVQTGSDSDTETVRGLWGQSSRDAFLAEPLRHYALPASPDQAAEAEGARVPAEELTPHLAALLETHPQRRFVVELAGGLLVPYRDGYQQLDWLASLRGRIELLLVARSGLGTLNHTQLSLEALRRRGLEPRCLLLVGEPHPRNLAYLRRTAGLARLHSLPPLAPLEAAALARATAAVDPADLLP